LAVPRACPVTLATDLVDAIPDVLKTHLPDAV
jgi:hypothetical protein